MIVESLTSSDVKQKNKENILQFIYNQKTTHQQLICEALHLSRPTVIPILRECEENHMIEKNGFYDSTGGRKANAICFIEEARVAVGVELLQNTYEIVILNLYGETTYSAKYRCAFQYSDRYFKQVCDSIIKLIHDNGIPSAKILGVGIVLQGLISSDGARVTYGKILNCTGLSIKAFTQLLPYQCMFFHDAESAALDELWQSPEISDAIYMNIREHVSGAIIVNREFLKGKELKSGVFEHMTLIPGGRSCYCGHKGCVDTYCSTQALLQGKESLTTFFSKLRKGDPDCEAVWRSYLEYLAASINNLHMFIDYLVIIGGTLTPYLCDADILALHRMIYDHTAFPTKNTFIRPSRCINISLGRGAALSYINNYLRTIMGR